MDKLHPTPPLDMFARQWPGFDIKESYSGELVSVAAAAGDQQPFAKQFNKVFGKSLPAPNQMSEIKDGFAFWSSPDQYMLLLNGENIEADLDVAQKLDGLGYTTLQSDGWASLDISGKRIFDVLERFLPIDLRQAPSNFATRTSGHHIAIIVLKYSDTKLQLLTPRSSAQSFLDALVQTAENVLD